MIGCAVCLKENAAGALVCVNCGAILVKEIGATTRKLSQEVEPGRAPGHTAHLGKLPPNGIACYVEMSAEPIITTLDERLVIGRQTDRRDQVTLDLTAYDAYRLGVSRNHIALVRKNGQIYVHDVGSVNGSWIAGQRLKPYELYALPSGTAILLGQMTIYIYY